MEKALRFFEDSKERFTEELFEFLRIPSVSADPERADAMERCASWLAKHLKSIGLERVELIETDLHPLIYAESETQQGRPTILVYGHYDVQPDDPLDEWTSPPFEPEVRDGQIYARGATDDKGQLFAHIKAVEAWLTSEGSLPANIKFIIEGEEECGGESLDKFLRANPDLLECDDVVVSDSSQFAQNVPAVCYGLRGLVYFEVSVAGPSQDLHSGSFGGAVCNPANALAKLIASLKDENDRIAIPGVYDDVRPLSDKERSEFASLPFDMEQYKGAIGIKDVCTENGFSVLEAQWARPTLDVNGIFGGYMGEGGKTIIPARAGAKVSMRLVPDQDPDRIIELFTKAVGERAPKGVRVKVDVLAKAKPFIVDPDEPIIEKARQALEAGFGHKAVLIREGGTIPIVEAFSDVLGAPVLLVGFGLNTDGAHSPNEHFALANFYGGIKTAINLYEKLGGI